jgi:hypothetical protein
MKLYTKENLINEFKKIAKMGWIENTRNGNSGGVGNTLEDLLGIEENNLPIPNAAEWELKAQRLDTSSLTTLFHMEPSPRAVKFVPKVLLLNYGWKHEEAGEKYPDSEMSFRQTIHGNSASDRGFIVKIDKKNRKVLISFDYANVADRHSEWLRTVTQNIGLAELNPQPYWGFDDLAHKAGTKLLNCFYVQAEVKKDGGKEFYRYSKVTMLQKFSFDGFLQELENGNVLVDFDARTGHNHGTKFRLRQSCFPNLYEIVTVIF